MFEKIYRSAVFGEPLDCGGVFFSGHTSTLTNCAMVWHLYTDNPTLKVLAWVGVAVGVFLMLIVRLHYTVDIVYGFLITLVAWDVYLRLTKNKSFLKWRFWKWFEGNPIPVSDGSTFLDKLTSWMCCKDPNAHFYKELPSELSPATDMSRTNSAASIDKMEAGTAEDHVDNNGSTKQLQNGEHQEEDDPNLVISR